MSLTATLLHLGIAEVFGVSGKEVLGWLSERFTDHSQAMPQAILTANQRTWQVIGMALGGDGYFTRVKNRLQDSDLENLRKTIRPVLATCGADLCTQAGVEIEALHRKLSGGATLKQAHDGLARYSSLDEQADDALKAIEKIPEDLRSLAPALSEILSLTFAGPPLLKGVYLFFFCRIVVKQPELVAGISLARMAAFRQQHAEGFALLDDRTAGILDQIDLAHLAIEQLSGQVGSGFADVRRKQDEQTEHLGRIEAVAGDTRDAAVVAGRDAAGGRRASEEGREAAFGARVAAVSAERAAEGAQGEAGQARFAAEKNQAALELLIEGHRELKCEVNALREEKGLRRPVRGGDSLSIRNDREKQRVREFLRRFRLLPEELQRSDPSLLNGLGVLELAIGENEAARQCFEETAAASTDSRGRAEAYYNAYQTLLQEGEKGREQALAKLLKAAELDPLRFLPFPTDKYVPERILGAGGFAVAFLCRHHLTRRTLVVKAIRTDRLDLDPADVIGEAQVLEDLEHPTIIRLRDCGFADTAKTRPYLVTDFFDGPTLADHVKKNGAIPAAEFLPLARLVAQGLCAAHGKGILHRDVTPKNILVRKKGSEWEARLIDFGLAQRHVTFSDADGTQVEGRTPGSRDVAGTPDYAAPEQMGKRKEAVDRYSDVYGFGRFCYYALFRTPTPLGRHWRDLPATLRDLVEQCVEDAPEDRPQEFESILATMLQLQGPQAPAPFAKSVPLAPPPSPPVAKPAVPPIQHFQVDMPGTLWRRTAGASPPNGPLNAKWEEICRTPAQIDARPGEQYLLVSSPAVADADLAGLANLRGLTALHLQWLPEGGDKQVTDAGLAHLRGLTALQSFGLYACNRITDAGLAHLRNLTALEQLELCNCERITDAGLAHLRNLTALQSLNVAGSERTDAGLAHLRGLTALQSLNLASSKQLTDAGLAHLRGLTVLKTLELCNCERITDAGLAHLRNLTALQSLGLMGCVRVTNTGLAHLQNLTALEYLDLRGCERVTDAGLAHLRNLTALQHLNLWSCNRVTDTGLAHLRGLTALQILQLFACRITDHGLVHLRGLTALEHLELRECAEITDAGVAALQKELPDCTMIR